MKEYFKSGILFLLLLSVFFSENFGQTDTVNIRKSALKVFIDCSSCDEEFIKREIDFVNYVRDTKEA